MTERHCPHGFHSCDEIKKLEEQIKLLGSSAPRKNSRQVAEMVFESAKTAFPDDDHEPEDKEGAIQEIEGILEREAGLKEDAELNREREKNEREGRGL